MSLSDREEEMLESLWVELVEKKKESSDASLLKDDESLKELSSLGYVKIKDNQVTLTARGKEEARSCVRRHRLAERLFVDIFDVKKKQVHEPSCKFEHLLHRGLDESVCILLGHPKACPHGRAIPEGKCCQDVKRLPRRLIMVLSELDINKKATIAYLQTQDQPALQKLIAMGALPNSEITLIQKFPTIVFQIGRSQFAIDKELASHVYVRLI